MRISHMIDNEIMAIELKVFRDLREPENEIFKKVISRNLKIKNKAKSTT